jgi:hypothetical protein
MWQAKGGEEVSNRREQRARHARATRADMMEFYLEAIGETDRAVWFTDGENRVWLPKSQIEAKHVKDSDFQVFVPIWLAKEKGLI